MHKKRRFIAVVNLKFIVRLYGLLVLCIAQSYINAQHNYVLLEDDSYQFSVFTPEHMILNYDTFRLDHDIYYTVYQGSQVDESDTLYFRIDLWENPQESLDSSMVAARTMLDSTLVLIADRLQGNPEYAEHMYRNGWPAVLVRYRLGVHNRSAKVLLVRRLHRYYLLTVVASPKSLLRQSVNRFLHSFKLFE